MPYHFLIVLAYAHSERHWSPRAIMLTSHHCRHLCWIIGSGYNSHHLPTLPHSYRYFVFLKCLVFSPNVSVHVCVCVRDFTNWACLQHLSFSVLCINCLSLSNVCNCTCIKFCSVCVFVCVCVCARMCMCVMCVCMLLCVCVCVYFHLPL